MGATRIRANAGDIGDALCVGLHLELRHRELGHVDREVGAGIVAVEQVEEFDERVDLPALVDFERTRDAQV